MVTVFEKGLFSFLFHTLLFFLLLGYLSAEEGINSAQTFKGHVVSVQKLNCVTKPSPSLQFLLQTDTCLYTVEVSPEWVLNAGGIVIVPHEKIEVEGTLFESAGKKIILARQIKKNGILIKLRSKDGTPYWGEQRNLKPGWL